MNGREITDKIFVGYGTSRFEDLMAKPTENAMETQKDFCKNDIHDWKYDTTKIPQERVCKCCGVHNIAVMDDGNRLSSWQVVQNVLV